MRAIACTAVLFFAGTPLFVASTNADEKQDRKKREARIDFLIEKLAVDSPSGNIKFSPRDKQEMAVQAWLSLRDFGPEAFPKLIEHLQDDRKSFTHDSGSTDKTWTVGRACLDLLWCNLEPYNNMMYSSSIPPEKYYWRPDYCREFLNTPKKARAWLAARQSRSLVDLQIEVLEWVTSNRSKRKVEVSVEDRKHLLDLLDTLKRTKKPLKPAIPWSM